MAPPGGRPGPPTSSAGRRARAPPGPDRWRSPGRRRGAGARPATTPTPGRSLQQMPCLVPHGRHRTHVRGVKQPILAGHDLTDKVVSIRPAFEPPLGGEPAANTRGGPDMGTTVRIEMVAVSTATN